jgi:hypothetical protein
LIVDDVPFCGVVSMIQTDHHSGFCAGLAGNRVMGKVE